MKFILFLFFLLLQDSVFKSTTEITEFKTDNIGNLYIIQGDKILLADAEGNKLFEYSNPKLGTITSIHQTSGLRTVLFYKDLSTFLILDNTLTPQSPAVNLNNHNLNYISLICTSENNSYWCYSEEKKSLIRITQQLNPISKSSNLEMTLNRTCSPTQLMERNGTLYLNDPKNGIHVFDNFGNYDKTISILNCDHIDVQSGQLFYLQNGNILKYDLKNYMEEKIISDNQKIDNFEVNVKGIYLQKNNEIYFKKNL